MSERGPGRNPFEGVTDFVSEINRLRAIGTGRATAAEQVERTHASAWAPATDIFALGEDLVIRIELAVVPPEDVELRFAQGLLTITGYRSTDGADPEESLFYTRERYYGEFRRVITLPEGIEPEDVTATFEHGLVEVVVHQGAAVADPGHRIDLAAQREEPQRRTLG